MMIKEDNVAINIRIRINNIETYMSSIDTHM